MYISKQTLDIVKLFIFGKDVEICGNLLQSSDFQKYGIDKLVDNNQLLFYIETVGEKSSCLNKTYTKYCFHTHSKLSKGYPSAEDLFMPLRKRPDISIIFTIWGIWEINAGGKYELDRQYISTEYINKILEGIYRHTDGGRVNPLSENNYKAIIHYVNEINKVMNNLGYKFVLKFTDWRQIPDNYYLLN